MQGDQQATISLVFSSNTNTHKIADLQDHSEVHHPRFFEVAVSKVGACGAMGGIDEQANELPTCKG